jgi:N-acetylmuramoyl-L-alanine amidase
MQPPYNNSSLEDAEVPWSNLIGRLIPFGLFFAVAIATMFGAYLFFSPVEGNVEVVAAVRPSIFWAPLVKPVPPRPVTQRLAQSPEPMRFGIIAGHRGNDSGAVCEDGLTEAEVNFDIAERVVSQLRARGIRAELLDEFDERLPGYSGTAMI